MIGSAMMTRARSARCRSPTVGVTLDMSLLAEQLEKIGETRNDVAAQLRGRRLNGMTRLRLGEFVAARALLAAAVPGSPRKVDSTKPASHSRH